MAIDKNLFEKQSQSGCSNSHYEFHKTTCCNCVIVLDVELDTLYFDALDLKRRVEPFEQQSSCPICKASPWSYEEIPDVEVPTNWKWACS